MKHYFRKGVLGVTALLLMSSSLFAQTIRSYNYPLLKRNSYTPMFRIDIDSLNSFVKTLEINVDKRSVMDLDSIALFSSSDSIFSSQTSKLGVFNKGKIKIFEKIKDKYLWITTSVNIDANLRDQVLIKNVIIKGDGYQKIFDIDKIYRLGIALKKGGDERVNTYRIPGLTTSTKGTILAIYDMRRDQGRDLQGDIDIGVARMPRVASEFVPQKVALDRGTWGGLPEKFNGISDANILVDQQTGKIFVVGLWMYGVLDDRGQWIEGLTQKSKNWNHQWRNRGSQAGLDPKQTAQFLITESSDDGKTWSQPRDLTSDCKKSEWWLWAPSPGRGISLKDGTLVFPTQGRDKNGLPFSNITWSKDHGKTWHTSDPAYHNTTECAVVELSDGGVMLNMRDNRNAKEKSDKNGRAICVTYDLGNSWTEHSSSHSALIEPVCMGSLHKHFYTNRENHTKSVLIFSNPNSKNERNKQTLKFSFDEGKTWPQKYWIELDEGYGAGYSCLASKDNTTIAILYEGSQAQMTYQEVNIEDVLFR